LNLEVTKMQTAIEIMKEKVAMACQEAYIFSKQGEQLQYDFKEAQKRNERIKSDWHTVLVKQYETVNEEMMDIKKTNMRIEEQLVTQRVFQDHLKESLQKVDINSHSIDGLNQQRLASLKEDLEFKIKDWGEQRVLPVEKDVLETQRRLYLLEDKLQSSDEEEEEIPEQTEEKGHSK